MNRNSTKAARETEPSRYSEGLPKDERYRRASLIGCIFALSGIAAFGVFASNRDGSGRELLEVTEIVPLVQPRTQAVVPQAGPPRERIEVELITITPDGIEPKSITRPHSRFLLVTENRSGLPELRLRFDREAGNRLIDATITKGKLSSRYLTNLTPGTYVLTEASHPEWICRFTITPN